MQRRLFPGAIITGIQRDRPGTQFEIKTNTDGSVTGKAWGASSYTQVSGRWWINEGGQYCNDLRNSTGGVIAGCGYYYLVANRYYSGQTGAPTDPVIERQIRR